jgi:hypothetical protein
MTFINKFRDSDEIERRIMNFKLKVITVAKPVTSFDPKKLVW